MAKIAEHIFLSLLIAYRRYCLAHPNLYRLATSGRLPRDITRDFREHRLGEMTQDATLAWVSVKLMQQFHVRVAQADALHAGQDLVWAGRRDWLWPQGLGAEPVPGSDLTR